MNRLLGNPPNQLTEEEKAAKLQQLWEQQKAIVDAKGDDWIDRYGEIERQRVELERNYPDLPPTQCPIVVVEVQQTCGACPTAWQGKTADGLEVYARYRGGYLRVDVNDETVYGRQLDYGDDTEWMDHVPEQWKENMKSSDDLMKKMNGGFVSYDGSLTYEQLIFATKDWFVWPGENG